MADEIRRVLPLATRFETMCEHGDRHLPKRAQLQLKLLTAGFDSTATHLTGNAWRCAKRFAAESYCEHASPAGAALQRCALALVHQVAQAIADEVD